MITHISDRLNIIKRHAYDPTELAVLNVSLYWYQMELRILLYMHLNDLISLSKHFELPDTKNN